MKRVVWCAVLLCGVGAQISAGRLNAQGALGNQGFGYPTGQLSAAALGAGGSTGELDPSSPINPAAIASNGRYSVMLQYEPEFRTTTVDGITSANTILRFPNFLATGRYGRFTVAASVSTFLDRTWVNSYADSLFIGGAWEQSQMRTASNGAINDSRVALAYVVNPRVRVGLALHGFSGENRIVFSRSFPDSSGLGALAQSNAISYGGRAFSGGLVADVREGLTLATSFRVGGEIDAELNGGVVGKATIPTRFGASASWLALPGATVTARYDHTKWNDLRGLGSAVSLFDATELGLGMDIIGPRIAGTSMLVRIGARDRTLPFGSNGDRVSERAFSFGAGLPMARGRGQIDIALQRAAREAGPTTERSWFLSVGVGIRP